MCPNNSAATREDRAAREASERANARADEALAAARKATEFAGTALIAPADSERARRAAEEKQRRIVQAGGGLVPLPLNDAPVATRALFGI